MYTKDTSQFNLLKELYELRDGNGVLGIAASKLETSSLVINELEADGYLKKIERKKDEIKLGKPATDFLAIWITDKGIADWEIYLASIPKSTEAVSKFSELKQKMIAGTITVMEKDELLKLVVNRV